MLMGITIVGAVLIAVSNLLADLALAWLDPRSR
jgi:ABC-type dipeptide/oligopeptide/nickel transport system permease component